jgi:hypothetical protein
MQEQLSTSVLENDAIYLNTNATDRIAGKPRETAGSAWAHNGEKEIRERV